MINILLKLLFIGIFFSSCSLNLKPPPKKEIIYTIVECPSTQEMSVNNIEKLLENTEWITFQSVEEKFRDITTIYKYMYDPQKGKRFLTIKNDNRARTNHTVVESYKIIEDVWGTGRYGVFVGKDSIELGDTWEVATEFVFKDYYTIIDWYFRVRKDSAITPIENAVRLPELIPNTQYYERIN